MGYTTDFAGQFNLNKKLTPELHTFLTKLAGTRRMKRNVDEAIYGVEGEFYVRGEGFMGQNNEDSVLDHNKPPRTQPGLWLQWIPTEDGMGLEWDGNEKFYSYGEWMVYLIEKILKPNGYVVNGSVKYRGEDADDVGRLNVVDNVVTLAPYEGDEVTYSPVVQQLNTTTWKYDDHSMETDITYPLADETIEEETPVKDSSQKTERELLNEVLGLLYMGQSEEAEGIIQDRLAALDHHGVS